MNGNVVESVAALKPIIVFLEAPCAAVDSWLRRVAKKAGTSIYTVNTIEEAK